MLYQNVFKSLKSSQLSICLLSRRGVYEKPSIIMHKDVVDAYKKTKMEEEIEKEEEMKKMNPNPDLPIDGMLNPFLKPAPRCILCHHGIQLDYKNVRLLSQFTSSYTGRIYDRGVTGLCLYMQKRVAKLIKRARMFGYMPYEIKDPRYVQDPKLFDPFKRKQ